ncbi:MAG: HAD-IC family P-type ATPase, partial [Desulfobacterales bacterium]|nr:HAD-IC family P-type ATPase [Desulfobacterales bacterium]
VAQICEILNSTVHLKSEIQTKAENVIDKAVIPTLAISVAALPALGMVGAASVLNNRLGYRLLIVTSIGTLNHLQLISKKGILIKDGRVLDILGKVNTLIFDKTGTLTLSKFHVTEIHSCSEHTSDEILAYAAASEEKQSHPIASAILEEAEKRGVKLPPFENTEYIIGYGIKVLINNEYIYLGSNRFMDREGIKIPPLIEEIIKKSHIEGNSVVLVARSKNIIGGIELSPIIRPEAFSIIKEIKKRSIGETYIISGDHEIPTKKLAEKLGIDHYFAEILPHQKAEIVEKLQKSGKSVCFIGDGINDSIALKKADVSVSLRGASTAATDTAQIILMNENLENLLFIFEQAQAHEKTLKNCLATILGASALGLGGVVLFDFELVATTILRVASLGASLGVAMLPIIKHQSNKN